MREKLAQVCKWSFWPFKVIGKKILTGSQGADTLKTIQQSSNDFSRPVGLREATQKLYSKEGVYGFFKGGMVRGARVVSAVTIMGFVTEKMEDLFKERNAEVSSEHQKRLTR